MLVPGGTNSSPLKNQELGVGLAAGALRITRLAVKIAISAYNFETDPRPLIIKIRYEPVPSRADPIRQGSPNEPPEECAQLPALNASQPSILATSELQFEIKFCAQIYKTRKKFDLYVYINSGKSWPILRLEARLRLPRPLTAGN